MCSVLILLLLLDQ